tara:strand:- start:917 stop:1285 length:369 start_codon:yes stop_codon:yes gene_type:complete
MFRIVFVCLGNLYRSVYAEDKFKKMVSGLNVDVSSTGLLKLDNEVHIKRVKNADLVLTMEENQTEFVKELTDVPVFTLREYVFGDNKDIEIDDPISGGNPNFKKEIDECLVLLLEKIKGELK